MGLGLQISRRPYRTGIYQKPKTKNQKRSFQGFGLVNEHDGNVVLDFVNQAALVTDEAVAILVQANVPLALGTGQDFQEFFADGHMFLQIVQKEYYAATYLWRAMPALHLLCL
jgi:hypothetical protein